MKLNSKKIQRNNKRYILGLVLFLVTAIISINGYAKPTPYWHCGADEDGCVKSSCLCIPQDLPASQPYCLDFNKTEHPCLRATQEQIQQNHCENNTRLYHSQKNCLNDYFSGEPDDGHCTAKSNFKCTLYCNKGGEQCKKTPPSLNAKI